ncbi:MAG: hypothetical protein KC414_05810, partial [Romboutsia sp.]|nr:hypothetical protein [Romboutsia sp.]
HNEIKLINLAPWIYNRKRYYNREHPSYHPDTSQYLNYWENEEKKIIEGVSILDQEGTNTEYDSNKPGGYRFLIPQHYWYINYCFIQHLPDPASPPTTIMPDLRDIDLYWFYIFLIALGFSGFTEDNEYSCHYLLERYEKHLEPGSKITFDLTPKEKKLWASIKPEVTNSKGYKKYIDPIEYLKKTFDRPLGNIIYSNDMYNIADMEVRGNGKSYRMMGLISHAFNFFGARTFEEYLKVKKGPTICVGSANSSKSGELLQKFQFSQNMLIDNFGAYIDDNENFTPGFFHKETSGVISSGNEKNPYRHQYKIKKGIFLKKAGTWTNIVHQSYADNPEAFVGQRSILMLEDEFGLNDNAIKCARADNSVMRMTGVKMGIAVKSGTGGNIFKVQQAREIFYNPTDYGYISLPDL